MKKALLGLLFIAKICNAQTVISGVYVQSSTSTTATIVWTTSTPSTSQIKYGTDDTIPYATNVNYTLLTSHSMTLTILTATQPYYFAVISTASGQTSQSSTYEFALCGSATIPVTGTVNPVYGYGTYMMTWNPPIGAVGTPTVCGLTVATTVTGSLNAFGSLTAVVADSLKVTPGPGSWTVTVADQGNLAPITVTVPLSAEGQDLSAQLQAAAATAGLVDVIANTITSKCWPAFVCQGGGGGVTGSGTADYATMWTGTTSIGNAQSTDGTANVQYSPGASNLTVITTLGQGSYFDVENGCGGLAIGSESMDYCTGESGNSGNVAYGTDTMEDTSAGGISENVAIGNDAFSDVGQNASTNIAIGNNTMEDTSESTSSNPVANNIALGNQTMYDSGASTSENVAIGDNAMEDSSYGPSYDVALGYYSLNDNGSGTNNIALGYYAMEDVGGSTSSYNVALGNDAMEDSSNANNYNIAIGYYAMEDASSAQNTVAVGAYAGYGVTAENMAGQNDLYLGYNAAPYGESDSNEIVIGSNTSGNGNNTTTISAGTYPIVLPTSAPTSSDGILDCAGSSSPYICDWAASGSGTVTSFSAGNLSPLFTTSVATATTTPALSFTLSSAAQNSVFAGPASGGSGVPSFQTAPTISGANLTALPSSTGLYPTLNQSTTGNAATATNLASYPTLCSGAEFSQGLSSGSNNCATPGTGLSGMTASQVPIAATSTTVTSSKALAGSGAAITTGPSSSTNGDCVEFTGTSGQISDSGSGCGGSGGLTVGSTTIADGTSSYLLYDNSGVLGNYQYVPQANGGTGLNTASATGVPQVASGTWSVSTALPASTTATTGSVGESDTNVATNAQVANNVSIWLMATGVGSIAASTTDYAQPEGTLSWGSLSVGKGVAFPRSGTIAKLTVCTGTPQPSTGSLTINLTYATTWASATNATGLSVSFAASAAAGCQTDSTDTFSYTAGYALALQGVNAATSSSAVPAMVYAEFTGAN